jgi:DNA repair protein RadD
MEAPRVIKLRDYQQVFTDRARERMRAGVKRLLMVGPTGCGKTVKAAFMQAGATKKGYVSWFVVHRREIAIRTAETFDAFGIDYGMVADGFPLQPDKLVQICMVDTLVNRLGKLPPPDGIVFDEAHHIVAGSHAAVAAANPDAWHIGLTATPERLDGAGLAPYFDEMIPGPQTGHLMKRGFLSPYRYYAPGAADLVGGREGFNRSNIADIMGNAKLIGDAVDEWGKHAEGMRTIGFEMNRKSSEATVLAFRAAGIEAHHIDSLMHRDKRRDLFKAFREGEITYLSQVAIAGEGVDIPGAECALLRYKSNSLTKFLQDVGRVFRPLYEDGFDQDNASDADRVAAIAAGPKPFAVILDMGGNAFDFGMPDDDRTWSLQGAKERRKLQAANDAIPIRQCPMCFAYTPSSLRACHCGFEHKTVWTPPAWAKGELFELERQGTSDKEFARIKLREEEKAQERAAKTLGALIDLARARNRVTPDRYKDPGKWAQMKIGLRQQARRGGFKKRA